MPWDLGASAQSLSPPHTSHLPGHFPVGWRGLETGGPKGPSSEQSSNPRIACWSLTVRVYTTEIMQCESRP